MQRRKERARFDLKRSVRDLLDAARHTEPVQLAERQRLEDQEIERPLEQFRLLTGWSYRHSVRRYDPTYRMSIRAPRREADHRAPLDGARSPAMSRRMELQPPLGTAPTLTSEDEWLWGWDPTPGIVSVWAEQTGAPSCGGDSPTTGELVREDERFRPWVLLDRLDDLQHLGARLAPGRHRWTRSLRIASSTDPARSASSSARPTGTLLPSAVLARRLAPTRQTVGSSARARRRTTVLALPPEEQYLVATGRTYFRDLAFDDLRRLQFDLETTGLDPRAIASS